MASPVPVVLEDPASHTQNKDEVSMSPVQAPNSDLQQVDSDPLGVIRKVCWRFHSVVRQLRQRRDDRSTLEVEDETDVQDVLQTLLCSQFDDVQTEAWTPSYANGTPRTDLVVKQDGIVVVVKKTRQGISGKTLADQLGVDIARYLGHPSCKTLMCFIYDPEGRIGNPGALEAALTGQQNGRRIEVLISPK
jgi:DpnII restriction endonuclease